jgi:hypothetical protein
MKTWILKSLNVITNGFDIFVKDYLGKISSQTLGWIAIVLCHCAPVPTLIAVLMEQNDKLPPVDVIMFVWSALIVTFVKSLIDRNFLYMATICLGFVAHSLIMGMILFK